ncbi:hypothetical protein SKAU_G00279980 [Synaphobranchus kaupii]|uniref:DDE Tnp4 domain-containing protein n=1 Tax=Synaphobranchus kaupii TaxID=118154 RepID=A0A9Q1ILR4_SYNKA|nr:hypothetical protein SKAU_G00279980 [Synaphobranchus kaupii]
MNARNRILAIALAMDIDEDPAVRRRGRSVWVHDINRGRRQFGEYHRLVQELHLDDAWFKAYFRLNRQQFEEVLQKIGPTIAKMQTNYRETISPAERLHLSEGAKAWRKIAGDYERLWAFPNCLGAMDGKHVVIQAPPSSGSQYFNCKGAFSIMLLAVVDAHYRFTLVDVGAYGRSSDGGTLASSAFGTALRLGNLDLPEDRPLPGADHLGPQPYVFLADEAFPLRRNLLRPYPGQHLGGERRIFNYRLSHARRMVECSFGILATQWRLYRRVLGVSPEVAECVVKATCILHNFLRWDYDGEDVPRTTTVPTDSQGAVQRIPRVGSNNASRDAAAVRDLHKLLLLSRRSSALARQHPLSPTTPRPPAPYHRQQTSYYTHP